LCVCVCVCVCVLVGLELRAFTLSLSTIPIFVMGGLVLNHDPPDLCLLSS
jgi:hypothetical protein